MKVKKMKRVLAIAGIVILAVIYLATFIIGLMGKAEAKDLLMACIVCTVVVPVLMYAMLMVEKILSRSETDEVPGNTQQEQPDKNE